MELTWTLDKDEENAHEAELVLRAATDSTAFATLYSRYANRVYWFLMTLVESEEEAADLTQQTFLLAFQALPRYTQRGVPFSSWLFRIARNAATDAHRRQRQVLPWSERYGALLTTGTPDPEASVMRHEDLRRVQALVAELGPDQRELIALRFGAGLTCVEIGGVLGKKPATVTKQIQRILGRLKEQCRER